MPKLKSKSWGRFFPEYELQRRETGFKLSLGWEDKLKYTLYSSFRPCNSWDPANDCTGEYRSGIFNMEFSPDGKQLIAACENKAIMVFDPLTKKLIHDVPDAHSSCVNAIKFLDNRLFATCSDDRTVALWDVRNVGKNITRLMGHDHWVKNVEYSSEDGMIVSSGFDGRILGWNINRYAENNSFTELSKMEGLMRMRLTPDLSKLVICTNEGYIGVVHNLSLKHLSSDLKDIAYMFPLMRSPNVNIEESLNSSDRVSSSRNRIEFISDFPAENAAEVIHSLQVHPQGWCVLSRNTSTADSSEWTCVHDIQELGSEEVSEENETSAAQSEDDNKNNNNEDRERDGRLALTITPRMEVFLRQARRSAGTVRERRTCSRNSRRMDTERDPEDSEYDIHLRFSSMDVFEALQHIETRRLRDRGLARPAQEPGPSRSGSQINHDDFRIRHRREAETSNGPEEGGHRRSIMVLRPGMQSSTIVLPLPVNNIRPFYWQQRKTGNTPRLTNYIEEPNKGKGFIKELCFSSDGRLICSPFDCGVRLMTFNDKCSELSHCVQKTPQLLHVVSEISCHSNSVVSTKFSPSDCLLVSGCLNGKIVWHQPVL